MIKALTISAVAAASIAAPAQADHDKSYIVSVKDVYTTGEVCTQSGITFSDTNFTFFLPIDGGKVCTDQHTYKHTKVVFVVDGVTYVTYIKK